MLHPRLLLVLASLGACGDNTADGVEAERNSSTSDAAPPTSTADAARLAASDAESDASVARASDAAVIPSDPRVATQTSPQLDAAVNAEGRGPSPDARVAKLGTQPDASSPRIDAAAPSLDATISVDGELPAADATIEPDGGANGDEKLAAAVLEKYRACGVVGAGAFVVPAPKDAFGRCKASCVLAADCGDVQPTVCDGDEADDELVNCLNQTCNDLPLDDGFDCGEYRIRQEFVCDLSSDCDDERDESNCGRFRCADGTTVASDRVRCDGQPQCGDSSDERDCAAYCPAP